MHNYKNLNLYPFTLLIVLNGIEMKWKEVSLAAEEDF